MPRDLFGDVTRPFAGVGGRSRLTVPVSLAAHVGVVAAVVVVPLLASDALPALRESLTVSVITPVVPPAPPVRRLERVATPQPNQNAAPLDAPVGLPTVDPGPVESGAPDLGVIVGPVTSANELTPPPSPPAEVVEAPKAPVRVGIVAPPTKIHDVAPVYPPFALVARKQGIVIIEATIDTSGTVVDARVLRSEPLLDQAALDAVRQWRYTPTRLNGQPVAVIMTVTVRFQLG